MLQLLFTAVLFVENLHDVNSSPVPEATHAPDENWFIKTLHYMRHNPETLQELIYEDYPMTEGDMILPDDRNAVKNTWPTLNIPYVISTELIHRTDDIVAAMQMVSAHTCLSFHKRTSELNYLLFKISDGCASFVGCNGGGQPVFIGPLCITGNIVHEIIHSLGFYHEHTRMDRDKYITVLTENIMPGMERNFEKQNGETFNLGYDIYSIMHYGGTAFSVNGKATIQAKSNVKGMGQRLVMTQTDVERIRRLYRCDEMDTQIPPNADQVEYDVSANNTGDAVTPTVEGPPAAVNQPNSATRGHKKTS